jgi:hypothetical protein
MSGDDRPWWQDALRRTCSAVPLVFVATATAVDALALAPALLGSPLFLVFGLPLLLILASWTVKYALALIDHGARGLPPPVLSVEMVNPVNGRPLAALLLVAAGLGATQLAGHVAPWAPALLGLLLAAIFPAAIAVLAIEDPWLRAFWPPAIVGLVRALGLRYGVVLLTTVLLAYGVYAAVGRLPPLLLLPLALWGLLIVATLLGAAIHDRRDALGLEAWASPQRAAAREALIHAKARAQVLDEIYGYVRARRLDTAWHTTERYLDDAGWDIELCRWLRDRASGWDEDSIAQGLTRRLVTRLLALGRTAEAFGEIDAWRQAGRQYRPQNGRELARLVGQARSLGNAALGQRLLDECAGFFPGDPEVQALTGAARPPLA